MRSAKAMGLLALALLVSGLLSGCQANESQRDFGYYGGGYGGYPGGYGGYPGSYGGYRSRGAYRGYDRYPGAAYGRGYRSGDGYRQRAPSPSNGQIGRPPPAQGARPPLVGPDGRINPGGYR